MKRPAPAWTWRAGSVLVAFAILLLWEGVAGCRLVSPVFLPTPLAALASLRDGFVSGELWPLISGTVERMLLGWALASLIGVAVGALLLALFIGRAVAVRRRRRRSRHFRPDPGGSRRQSPVRSCERSDPERAAGRR